MKRHYITPYAFVHEFQPMTMLATSPEPQAEEGTIEFVSDDETEENKWVLNPGGFD